MSNDVSLYLEQMQDQTFFGNHEIKGSIRNSIYWYQKNANKSHFYFRTVGFMAILLSVSLPFVLSVWPKSISGITPTEITAILSWLIALAGGASGFFQWGRTWQSRTETFLRLERLLMEWEVMVHIPNATIEHVTTATKNLVIESREAIKSETGAFFEEVQFPDINSIKNNLND